MIEKKKGKPLEDDGFIERLYKKLEKMPKDKRDNILTGIEEMSKGLRAAAGEPPRKPIGKKKKSRTRSSKKGEGKS